jgi:hypothetical protein
VSLCAFPPARFSFQSLTLIAALLVFGSATVDASTLRHHAAVTGSRVTIVFGQEMGNIRPFSITISSNGAVKSNGPVRLKGSSAKMSRDAVLGLVLLAQTEAFRTLPSFTSCPGALPDLANRYVSIKTPGWDHRASARGVCLDGLNQLFAVLMGATHASL